MKEYPKEKKTGRLQELQERFQRLEKDITDSETKTALSLLNGMVQELWKQIKKTDSKSGDDHSLRSIANMYHHAPRMEGKALNLPLDEGTQAPDFELPDAEGNMIRLSDYKGSTVLLVFYPLDWSPGCSQQLDLYQHEMKEFEKRGIKVLGISVDSIYSHGAWSAVRGIRFPLLSDFNPKGEVAKKYNVFRDIDGFSERALYIIDDNGIIRYGYISLLIHHVPDIYILLNKIDEIRKPVETY